MTAEYFKQEFRRDLLAVLGRIADALEAFNAYYIYREKE